MGYGMAFAWSAYVVLWSLFAFSITALWPQPRVFFHGSSTVWVSPALRLSFVNRTSELSSAWGIGDGIQQLL